MKKTVKKAALFALSPVLPLSLCQSALAAGDNGGSFTTTLLIVLAVVLAAVVVLALGYIKKLKGESSQAIKEKDKEIAELTRKTQEQKAPEPAPQPKTLDSQQVADFMEHALADGEFQVYMQPQVDQFTKRIIGAEALVRWVRPGVGVITPGSFMPTFEKSGFITELDKDMFRKVCEFQSKRLQAKRSTVPIAVNLSRVDLADESMYRTIEEAIKEYDVPTSLIQIEITASAFVHDPVLMAGAVDRLRGMGFAVGIDDYGKNGFTDDLLSDVSSDTIKLDVRTLQDDDLEKKRAVSAMLRQGHLADSNILLESVETEAQADYFRYIGFRNVQGYLFYKPMPAGEFEELMETAEKNPAAR